MNMGILMTLSIILSLLGMVALGAYAVRRDARDFREAENGRIPPVLACLAGAEWLAAGILAVICGLFLGSYTVLLVSVRTTPPDGFWRFADSMTAAVRLIPFAVTCLSCLLFWLAIASLRFRRTAGLLTSA